MPHGGDRKSANQDANLHLDRQQAMVAELANMEVGDNKGAHRPSEGSANLHTLPGQVSQSDADKSGKPAGDGGE
jgi:hypothetical protein